MKHKTARFLPFLITLAGMAMVYSCTQSSPFGSELLDDQTAEYLYTDTVTVRYFVEREDSTITADTRSTADYLLCGRVDDPVFGRSEAEIYSLLTLDDFDPEFVNTNARLDSVVMYLTYDPPGIYGDTMQRQTLRVFQLTESVELGKNYYSNQSLQAGQEIGSVQFTPRPRTVSKIDTGAAAAKGVFLRVPLSGAFGESLLKMDSINMLSDSAFYKALRGIKIVSSSSETPGAMLAFDVNNVNFSKVRLYYSLNNVAKKFDYFFLGGNKFNRFTHAYNGTEAGRAIGRAGLEKLYVQGMDGIRIRVEFPYIDRLEDIVVNKAELQLTSATPFSEDKILEPARQLVLTELYGDTSRAFTSDVFFSYGTTGAGGFTVFGGYPEAENENGTYVKRYRMTLSQRLQDMVDDKSNDIKRKTLYLNIYPQRTAAQRAIFYGPASTFAPAKLTLKYTRIKG